MSESLERKDQNVKLHCDDNTVTIEIQKLNLFERYKGEYCY